MRLFTCLWAVLVGGITVTVAHAEPIPVTRTLLITDGRVLFHAGDDPFFDFDGSSPGFSLGISADGGPALSVPAGSTMNPSFAIDGRGVGAVLRIGDETIPLHATPPSVFMLITGPPVPIVRRPEFGGVDISVVFPFELTGSLIGTSFDGTEYRLSFLGHGRGSHSFFQKFSFTAYQGSVLTFESEAPIPEPATLFLVGTGIAAFWRTASKATRARLS